MSQVDYGIASSEFVVNARTEITDGDRAVASKNSGASAPPTTFADMSWMDTTNDILYIRDSGDANWLPIGIRDENGLVKTNAGNPNGSITGTWQGQPLFDTTNNLVWYYSGSSTVWYQAQHRNAINTNTSATLNLTAADRFIRNNSSANVTVNLVNPSSIDGLEITFVNPTQYTMTLSGYSVRGSSSFKVTPYTRGSIVASGGAYYVSQEFISDTINAGTITITATTTNPTKGTIGIDQINYQRVGEEIIVHGVYNQTTAGTAGSGNYIFAVPGGWAINATKLGNYVGSGGFEHRLGGWNSHFPGTNSFTGDVVYATTTTVKFWGEENASETEIVVGSVSAALNSTNISYSFSFRAPITNW